MSLRNVIENPEHHVYVVHESVDESSIDKNKDIHILKNKDGVGVDDVEVLYDFAITKVGKNNRKVIIITPTITQQAQNSLLKLVEDMQEGVFFYFCIPKNVLLLPTLKSRCIIIEAEQEDDISSTFKTFIKSTPAERLQSIENIWTQEENNRHESIASILKDSEIYINQLIKKGKREEVSKWSKAISSIHDSHKTGAMNKTTIQLLAFV